MPPLSSVSVLQPPKPEKRKEKRNRKERRNRGGKRREMGNGNGNGNVFYARCIILTNIPLCSFASPHLPPLTPPSSSLLSSSFPRCLTPSVSNYRFPARSVPVCTPLPQRPVSLTDRSTLLRQKAQPWGSSNSPLTGGRKRGGAINFIYHPRQIMTLRCASGL